MEINLTIQECYKEFIHEFGDRQFRKVKEKLFSSNTYIKNLHMIIGNKENIRAGTLIAIVSDIRYFAFSSKRNVALGSVMLLEQWINYSNSNYELLSSKQIDNLIEEIMMKTSKMFW